MTSLHSLGGFPLSFALGEMLADKESYKISGTVLKRGRGGWILRRPCKRRQGFSLLGGCRCLGGRCCGCSSRRAAGVHLLCAESACDVSRPSVRAASAVAHVPLLSGVSASGVGGGSGPPGPASGLTLRKPQVTGLQAQYHLCPNILFSPAVVLRMTS